MSSKSWAIHSEKMHKALIKSGGDVELVTLEEGDHFLSQGDHRLLAFRKMGEFLRRYIGDNAK